MHLGFIKKTQTKEAWTSRERSVAVWSNYFFDLSVFILISQHVSRDPPPQCALSSAMASVSSSSRRSSSSYRSSSRYSTSSSYRSEGSLGGLSDSLDPIYEPFLDSADGSSLFGEESSGGPVCSTPFGSRLSSRSSYGHTAPVGGAVTGTGGAVRCLGDCYYLSADLRQFEPHDIAVMAFNHHVVIHAQKVLDDGSVSNTFTHKSLFPEDMDPLSVSATFNPDGSLLVSVRRTLEPLGVKNYRSEAHL